MKRLKSIVRPFRITGAGLALGTIEGVRHPDRLSNQKIAGLWTFATVWLAGVLIAAMTGGYQLFAAALKDFVTFEVTAAQFTGFEGLIPTALAVATTLAAILVPVAYFQVRKEVQPTQEELSPFPTQQEFGRFQHLFTMVGVEELLRVGILWTLSTFVDGSPAVYLGVLVSSGLWASLAWCIRRNSTVLALHLIYGVLLSVVAISYGCFGSVLTALVFMLMLIAADRWDVTNYAEVIVTIIRLLVLGAAVAAFVILEGKGFADLQLWVTAFVGGQELPDMEDTSYLIGGVILTSAASLTAQLFACDRDGNAPEWDFWRVAGRQTLIFLVLVWAFLFAVAAPGAPIMKVFIALIVLLLFAPTQTGSGLVRMSIESSALLMVAVSFFDKLPVRTAAMLITMTYAVQVVEWIFRYIPKGDCEEDNAFAGRKSWIARATGSGRRRRRGGLTAVTAHAPGASSPRLEPGVRGTQRAASWGSDHQGRQAS